MKTQWEKKYIAIMIFCCQRLIKSDRAYYKVLARDLLSDLLARWDWLGFDRKDIPKSLAEISKTKDETVD